MATKSAWVSAFSELTNSAYRLPLPFVAIMEDDTDAIERFKKALHRIHVLVSELPND